MRVQNLPFRFQPAPAEIGRSALFLNCDIGQTAYNAGWRQWTGSVAWFRSVWVAGFASLWVAGLSSIRTALPRNHLPRSPLVTLPLAGQRPVTPPLPVSAASADGPMLAAGVPMRSVRPTYRTSSASYGNETHRASRRGGDERPAPIHSCSSQGAVLTFNPRSLISFAACFLPRR